jgi:hypothetical protein
VNHFSSPNWGLTPRLCGRRYWRFWVFAHAAKGAVLRKSEISGEQNEITGRVKQGKGAPKNCGTRDEISRAAEVGLF